MVNILFKEKDMSNKDIKPNMDFDVQGLNEEALEIYNKALNNGKEKDRQDNQESEQGA